MGFRKKGVLGALALALVCLVCLLLFFRGQPPPERTSEPSEENVTPRPDSPDEKLHLPKMDRRTTRTAMRRRLAVLVWPGMSARPLNYSRTILSWMQEWGFQCGFVTAQGTVGNESSSPLPAYVMESAWDLADTSESLNSIVLASGDLPPPEAAAVKQYLLSGGWVVMPSPEKGNALKEIEELLQLTPSRAATLMAPESPDSDNPLGAEEVRLLVPHSLAPGLAPDQWLEWAGPPGKVLYARQDQALPLLCFRRPELPAVRLVPFGDGGVVHWNFPLRPGALIEDTQLKAFLGDTLTWLFARTNWVKPEQKEGSVSGIVRRKEGQAIPGAKVTAHVYSEWGEPVQSFEVPSSEGGEFAFPAVEPAIYWVKAEAEGYYQVDRYLLARPKEGERIEVLMEPEASIFGHAYYGPGEDHPAGGIPVTLAPNCRISSAWGAETVADKNGWFSFGNLPAGQTFYLVANAEAEGWLGMQEASLPLDGGGLEVDIHLETLFTVKGTTINAATAEALPSVRVLAQPWRAEGSRFLFLDALSRATTSGENGGFALTLPEGHWVIRGEALGFSSMRALGGWNVAVSESRGIEPMSVVVELCPHAVLSGTVFNSSGEPAPKAKVTVDPGFIYWADDQGRYKTDLLRPVFTGHPRNPEFKVKVEWNDESASGFCTFRLARDGRRDVKSPLRPYAGLLRGAFPLDLHLKASTPEVSHVIIVGRVLDEDGKPASFAEVELAEPPTWPVESMFYAVPLKKRTSDSEGKFEFSCPDRELWLIRARKKVVDTQGKTALFSGESWQTLVEDVPPAAVEVRLRKAYIQGKVTKANAAPMRNRCLYFSLTLSTGPKTTTELFLEEDGEFTLFPPQQAVLTRPPSTRTYKEWLEKKWRHLIEGEATMPWEKGDTPEEGYVRLSVHSIGCGEADLGDVRWGEKSLVVAFPPAGRIRGFVIDADTGSPVPDAYVGVSQEGRGRTGGRTDGQGAFAFTGVPVGRCTVGAEKDGYWIREKEVEVPNGGEIHVEVEIWAYWTIRGRLLSKETGEPIAAQIQTVHGVYVSGRDGRFAIHAPAKRGERALSYPFAVPLEGTGLRSVRRNVRYDPRVREIDVGTIYVEREQKRPALD